MNRNLIFLKQSFSSKCSCLGKNMSTFCNTNDSLFQIHWVEEVSSTMDYARSILNERRDSNIKHHFAVIAKHQVSGRGTHGRVWESSSGNLYCTVCFPIQSIPCPVQLTPLLVGTNVVNIINNYVGEKSESGTPVVSLKWPNDVLINGEKVSGVLIEMEKEHLVIGIGCNIGSAPVVVGTGPNGARQATYLYQHCRKSDLATSDNVADLIESLRRDVGADIVKSFSDMLQQNDASSMSPCAKEAHGRNIVDRANQYMDKELQYLRLDHQASGQSVAGTKVVPLHINVDGTFQVMNVATGEQLQLVADYLM